MPEASAGTIAEFLHNKIFQDYGPPREIITDNGKQFTSDIVADLMQKVRTRHHLTSPYHPRSNGKVERYNGLLGKILTRMLVGQPVALWDAYLPVALYATRVRSHATTKFSPYQLVYGRQPKDFEIGWQEEDTIYGTQDENRKPSMRTHYERLLLARTARQEHYKQLVERAARLKLISGDEVKIEDTSPARRFEVGSYVLLENRLKTKFKLAWLGPYRVIKNHPLGTNAL